MTIVPFILFHFVFCKFIFTLLGQCILVAVVDKLFSLWDELADVLESIGICVVGQDLIPRSALESFLGDLSIVQCLDGVRITELEAKFTLHVIILRAKFL